jgi:superfamily I DNA/RNA helicase/mRNA-degrading endonuclease RelE of RelBE toxin-antitoxin system
MTATRELNIKPSCAHEIHAFPADQAAQLWEKIARLVGDPLPDGKLKKKLKAKGDLYRLRVGDYRLFYSFGDTWIRLIAIRRRASDTYGNKAGNLGAEAPRSLPPTGPEPDLGAAENGSSPPPFAFSVAAPPTTTGTKLPRALTPDGLASLKIPEPFHPLLLLCTTEEELLAAAVPSAVLERVVDNLFPKPLMEVLAEPDLAVQDPRDLVRFKEGNLLSFLLRLDPDQDKLVSWALEGPTMVRGGAGTGKSTVALYRVRALLRRPGASGRETALFTTYTRALQTVSRQLLAQLLSPTEMKRVRVATVDEVAVDIVGRRRQLGPFQGNPVATLAEVRDDFLPSGPTMFERKLRARALSKLADRYLLDEIAWMIEGREIDTLEEYLETPRPGRGVPLGAKMRTVVWELYHALRARITAAGQETFGAVRREAAEALRSGREALRYDCVVVDEAQDLQPVALSLLANLSRTPAGLFFAADAKQSIYARGAGWAGADARLQFKGRTAVLHRNYRSTAEIDAAAFALLDAEPDEVLAPSASPHSGPLPVLLRGAPQAREAHWAAQFVRQIARHLRVQRHAAAVLVPDRTTGEAVAKGMSLAGVAARFYHGRELDLAAPEVKVLTFHSAKGLEFPIVVVCGLRDGNYPIRDEYEEAEAFAEAMRHHRRLLYVACTRAMRGLMVIVPWGCRDVALIGLGDERWNMQEAP